MTIWSAPSPASSDFMPQIVSVPVLQARAVRVWLFFVAAMILATLVVGGATRLTESGLSIVEWKPVTGVLPPLSDSAWQAELEKYRAIPQYREINRGMSLDQFKTIYWWEWSHRVLARVTGMVFLLPFLYFLWRGYIPRGLKLRLWLIFAGGGALGAVGWWMVSSGVTGKLTSVSQYRLAFHLTLATVVYAAVLWTAQQLRTRSPAELPGDAPARLRFGALAIVLLVLVQVYLGALVAGLDAGLVYNTWPLIDGALVPSADRLWFVEPAWRNVFENTLTVQFNHRLMAYALWIAGAVARLRRLAHPTRRNRRDAAGRGDVAASGAGHRHIAAADADFLSDGASVSGHRGVVDRGRARRTVVAPGALRDQRGSIGKLNELRSSADRNEKCHHSRR